MQAFLALGVNAVVSGLISPAVVINPFTLSTAALALNAAGFILWLLLTGCAKEATTHQATAKGTSITDDMRLK
jgi:hypothetical protein